MPLDPNIDYEHLPPGTHMDETDVSVRAYFTQMSDEKLKTYNPNFTDEELMEWDGNFTNEGSLFLVCSEGDVDPEYYRAVMEEHIKHRHLT